MSTTLTKLVLHLRAIDDHRANDRGDIPGWVMVTLMTAAIVAAVWALAEPALTAMFNDAISEVAP